MTEYHQALLIMLTLVKSTSEYVHSRITTDKCQKAYAYGIQHAISIMNEEYHKSIGMMNLKKEISTLRSRDLMAFPKGWFTSRKDEIEYFHLAIDHVLEIIFNLEARFITGQGDAEPRNYRGKYIHLYNQSSLFKTNEGSNES